MILANRVITFKQCQELIRSPFGHLTWSWMACMSPFLLEWQFSFSSLLKNATCSRCMEDRVLGIPLNIIIPILAHPQFWTMLTYICTYVCIKSLLQKNVAIFQWPCFSFSSWEDSLSFALVTFLAKSSMTQHHHLYGWTCYIYWQVTTMRKTILKLCNHLWLRTISACSCNSQLAYRYHSSGESYHVSHSWWNKWWSVGTILLGNHNKWSLIRLNLVHQQYWNRLNRLITTAHHTLPNSIHGTFVLRVRQSRNRQ